MKTLIIEPGILPPLQHQHLDREDFSFTNAPGLDLPCGRCLTYRSAHTWQVAEYGRVVDCSGLVS